MCVALVIQHELRVGRIILSSVACLLLPYFPTLSHNGTIIRNGGKLLDTKCAFWFPLQLSSEVFLILRRIQRDTIINVHRYVILVTM
jgi:hypothetical protein